MGIDAPITSSSWLLGLHTYLDSCSIANHYYIFKVQTSFHQELNRIYDTQDLGLVLHSPFLASQEPRSGISSQDQRRTMLCQTGVYLTCGSEALAPSSHKGLDVGLMIVI